MDQLERECAVAFGDDRANPEKQLPSPHIERRPEPYSLPAKMRTEPCRQDFSEASKMVNARRREVPCPPPPRFRARDDCAVDRWRRAAHHDLVVTRRSVGVKIFSRPVGDEGLRRGCPS